MIERPTYICVRNMHMTAGDMLHLSMPSGRSVVVAITERVTSHELVRRLSNQLRDAELFSFLLKIANGVPLSDPTDAEVVASCLGMVGYSGLTDLGQQWVESFCAKTAQTTEPTNG